MSLFFFFVFASKGDDCLPPSKYNSPSGGVCAFSFVPSLVRSNLCVSEELSDGDDEDKVFDAPILSLIGVVVWFYREDERRL